jgi:hypothetical protein
MVADRWIPAQKLLAGCHALSALFKAAMGYVVVSAIGSPADEYPVLLLLYALSVAFYMPTLALSNSVSYTALEVVKLDPLKTFPPIRVFGTVGFICAMIATDVLGFQSNANQFFLSAGLGLAASAYALTLPACPVNNQHGKRSLVEALGLNAFALFKQRNPQSTTVLILPGCNHGNGMYKQTELYQNSIREFTEKYMGDHNV